VLRRTEQYRIDRRRSSDPFPERTPRSGEHRYTLGSIIWYALLRLVATIVIAWYLKDHLVNLAYGEWWSITMLSLYGIVIYPAQIQYRHFKKTSRRLLEQTLCSSCRHFNPEGLHCMMLDDHVSEFHLPCEGEGWEPKSYEDI